MTCIIVDDNELAIESLVELLKYFCPQVKVIGKAQTIKSAVAQISESRPDIVFLDVEMNDETGFDLFPYFPEPNFLVIFTTSHEKYAVKAFKTDCFDYLLKPIDPIELKNSIEKVEKEKKYSINPQNDRIIDSINYAKRIQDSILVAEFEIKKHLPELFILYLPKDIVSGDFYWFSALENNRDLILVAADCTGHGVPGAFLSMIGSTLLNEIVNQKKIYDPIQIIRKLAEGISSTLLNKENNSKYDDGMDISVCKISNNLEKILFAGANHNLYVINENGLKKSESQINSINGIFDLKSGSTLESIEVSIKCDTMIYLSTDGYADQWGDKGHRKFQNSNFEELLRGIFMLPVSDQKKKLEDTFYEWKGKAKQTDDILIIGFRT